MRPGRLITGEALGLDEEQKLQLAGRVIETIRTVDSQAPVLVSFDQPWAEYMSRRDAELSPLQFAEALVRSDLGIAGIGLEINLGTAPHATLPRDLFEFSNHLDTWGTLGLPLLLSLRAPSGGGFYAAVATVLVGIVFAADFRPPHGAGDHLESAARHRFRRICALWIGGFPRTHQAGVQCICGAAEEVFRVREGFGGPLDRALSGEPLRQHR